MPNTQKQAKTAVLALLALLMLPNLIWLVNGPGHRHWDEALVVPAVLLLFLFAIVGKRMWIACLSLSPFGALAPVESFYISRYLRPSTDEVIGTVFATTPSETLGYFGWLLAPLIVCVISGLLLALAAAWLCYRTKLGWNNRYREWALAGCMVLPPAVFAVNVTSSEGDLRDRINNGASLIVGLSQPVEAGFPFGTILRLWGYHREWNEMYAKHVELEKFRFHAKQLGAPKQRQIYVLVIGESSRRDHWQLFGYERPTNPELSKIHNLLPISDMLTSWPETVMAVPLVLTRKPVSNKTFVWHEASILRAMQEAGLETWWISNQQAIGRFDSPVSIYAMEARHVEFVNHANWQADGSYDDNLLDPLRRAIAQDPQKNLFIVVHMMGSHEPYDMRYPPSFKHFIPTISDSDDRASRASRLHNSYDNSVLYSDHILSQIINVLNDSGAISALWFESDHGETLPSPTCSLSGHGFGTRYDFMVPAFFWYSNTYATLFPQKIAHIKANADKRALSASTFESLIDMSDVYFAGQDSSWSLFSSNWKYRPRMVNGFWSADMDNAQFGKGCEVVLPN